MWFLLLNEKNIGRWALIFFCLKALRKIWKMTPLLCACAVVSLQPAIRANLRTDNQKNGRLGPCTYGCVGRKTVGSLQKEWQQNGDLYFRMLCLHINVFGLVFYTRQLVLCSEFWTLREKCTIMRSSSSAVACRNYKTMCVLCHRRPFF